VRASSVCPRLSRSGKTDPERSEAKEKLGREVSRRRSEGTRVRGTETPKAEVRQPKSRLKRFTDMQKAVYNKALSEIRAGRKSSCWMWYVIPTPPHIVNRVERGSSINRRYALRSDDEVRAYLRYVDPETGIDLRSNYLEIMMAVRDQLRTGKKASSLMGTMDEPKLKSSVKLF
jgi:uncharacterized protein (DUF1810 family)